MPTTEADADQDGNTTDDGEHGGENELSAGQPTAPCRFGGSRRWAGNLGLVEDGHSIGIEGVTELRSRVARYVECLENCVGQNVSMARRSEVCWTYNSRETIVVG